MQVTIRDRDALMAVAPATLAAHARAAGWTKTGPYGDHADVYDGAGLPEIILPRTRRLGDYVHVVAKLVDIFAAVAGTDELSLYRDLATADRDVIRIQADGAEGGAAVHDGIALLQGARDMLLAAACALASPQPTYRTDTHQEALAFLELVRWEPPVPGSGDVTLLPPKIPFPAPPRSDAGQTPAEDPLARRVTRRLADALAATREATTKTAAGDRAAFAQAVPRGASANLCEALVQLIAPFPAVAVRLTWARTRPRPPGRSVFRFAHQDVAILREAARLFRARAPQPNVQLQGFVARCPREAAEADRTIVLRTLLEGQVQSVAVALNPLDYRRALQAHAARALVIMEGDLAQTGRHWHLRNPCITGVINPPEAEA